MLRISLQKGTFKVFANTYNLIFPTDRPFVYLETPKGERLAELFVLSSVHNHSGYDDTLALETIDRETDNNEAPSRWRPAVEWEIIVHPFQAEDIQEALRSGRSIGELEEIAVSVTCASSVWRTKRYTIRCASDRFTYEIAVEGRGQLGEVNYFGGYSSANPRWGSGFFESGQSFTRGFNPEPNSDEVNYFGSGEGATIDLMGVPLPGRGDWFFTPPPFWYGFEHKHGWVGMGIEAMPGENLFTRYAYHGRRNGFHLTLDYEGYTQVNGWYMLPAVGFDFGEEPFSVLQAHVLALQSAGYIPGGDRDGYGSKEKIPTWWQEPIFCGWGAQSYLARRDHGRAPDYARQKEYEEFIHELEDKGIEPGIIVIDDKWQKTYGENKVDEQKWPDLPAFIRQQHEHGRKVLLWLKAWDAEGIPVDECIRNGGGRVVSVDPTNPAFEQRLRGAVRRMLSTNGYDADGFKVDFTARIPSGPGMCLYGELWGLELMKRYLRIIYEEAKQVKSEALIMTHTPHPYLADVVDMIRLNDINGRKDVNQAMQLRARVASIACPEAIIDTDNWPMTDRKEWRRYMKLQTDLGVPSLYYVSHIDSTKEPLRVEDYRLIQKIWEQHRAKVRAEAMGDQSAEQTPVHQESVPEHWAPEVRRRLLAKPARG